MANIAFNEAFYLTTYPDVAAAVSRGTIANAREHFDTFGRFEGRNPNAFFNTSFYLSQYPDVANARINPLNHFLDFGAKEGRLPNDNIDRAIDIDNNNGANEFNGAAYLAANQDVANAGYTASTAYQHYVLFGQFEGRAATLTNGTTLTGPFTSGTTVPGGPSDGVNATLTLDRDVLSAARIDAPVVVSSFTGANIQTLTSVDVLSGVGTQDVLNATLSSTERAGTSATLSGIETVNFTTVSGSLFDASKTTGATSINSVNSTADLTISNIASNIAIGSTNAAAGSSIDARFANSVVAGTSDVATVNVSGAGRGSADNTGIEINVRGETAGGFETIEIDSSGSASRLASLTSEINGTSSLKTINVTGDANLRVDDILTGVTTVDATDFTGNLRVSLDTAAAVSVTGGAGADYFDFFGGLTNADKVVGGDGRDTIAVSNLIGLGTGNQIAGVETLRLNDNATGVIDQNLISSVDSLVQNSTGDITFNNFNKADAADATKGVTILSTGDLVIGVESAAGLGSNADSVAFKIGSAAGSFLQNNDAATGAITVADVETLTFNVLADTFGQTASGTGALTVAAAQTVTITGGAAGEAFALSGGNAFGTAETLTRIDASGFAGNLVVSGNDGAQAILGGTGNDLILTGGRGDATTNGDVLTGGTGNDTFVFAAGDSTAALPNADVTGAFTPAQSALFTSITDLDLGGATAGTNADLIDLSAVLEAGNAIAVVNSGAATALTGASFDEGIDNLVAAGGVLNTAGDSGDAARAGLFTYGGDTFLIANEAGATATGYVEGDTIVIKVTGVTGTLDASDFVVSL